MASFMKWWKFLIRNVACGSVDYQNNEMTVDEEESSSCCYTIERFQVLEPIVFPSHSLNDSFSYITTNFPLPPHQSNKNKYVTLSVLITLWIMRNSCTPNCCVLSCTILLSLSFIIQQSRSSLAQSFLNEFLFSNLTCGWIYLQNMEIFLFKFMVKVLNILILLVSWWIIKTLLIKWIFQKVSLLKRIYPGKKKLVFHTNNWHFIPKTVWNTNP